jgi:isopentenyl-diphosphate delta-isomerase
MSKQKSIADRKTDHIRINLEEDVNSGLSTRLERYRFEHQALPELDLEEIDLGLELFAKNLGAPLLISSMTGGTKDAAEINRTLATAAQDTGIAMGLGSQRAAIENPALESTFQVRSVAPNILLFANLGAIQLNYRYGVSECQKAVEMVEADALILHLNALQEAIQPEGDTQFAGLLGKIEAVCRELPVPVIAKEVGWGFSESTTRQLVEAGVAAIYVAGAGGTSWSQVEMHRAGNPSQARLAAAFIDWGIPTAEAIQNVVRAAPDVTVFASGGLRNGVDIAKCISLGAKLGGLANPFLKAAIRSLDETILTINEVKRELQVCMFAAGAKNLEQLAGTTMIEI